MHISELKEISSMTFECEGHFIGFRTWTLKAYDEKKNLICTVDKSERHNYLKYVRFIVALKEKGFKLRECDRKQLKSGEKNFLMKEFIPYLKRSDLEEIAAIAGVTEDEINNIRNLSTSEQTCLAERLGLEYEELINNLDNLDKL